MALENKTKYKDNFNGMSKWFIISAIYCHMHSLEVVIF